MNSLRSSAGTITSAALRTRPDCSAQMAAMWKSTTLPTMTVLRLTPPEGAKRSGCDIKMIAASAYRISAGSYFYGDFNNEVKLRTQTYLTQRK
ncbi:hypothetical protein ACDW_45950 (plasmid) [Acidovorax sp. DW039]|nr:hypothetical protein ACDW_03870 [Acidovorax sp. DW039]BEU98889.1 hypothetical protein ACDW_45950 [Acidovorax sp. DW039]